MTLAVVTDSTSCLDPERAAELGVRVVPMGVRLGDWSFRDGEVPPEEFYVRLAEGTHRPSTSQPSPGDFLAAFTAAAGEGHAEVLCLTCSSAVSGTHQSATLAADMAPVPVRVVDSGTIGGGLLLYVGEVARAVQGGSDAPEAEALARAMSGRVWSTFATDSLPLLRSGGRLAGTLPDDAGVPVLAMERAIRPLGTARSAEEAVSWQAELVAASAARSPTRVTVGHGAVPELADQLAESLAGRPGVLEVDRYVVSTSVGAHAGAGTFGACYLAAPGAAAPE